MAYPVIYLATAVTANGAQSDKLYNGDNERADVYFTGVFNGASVVLEASPLNDGSASGYVDITNGVPITTNTVRALTIGKDTKLRAVVSNAGASTSLTIYARFYKE